MAPDREQPYPPLRNIEAFPIHHQGQTLICLHDPLGYVPTEITLSPAAFFIAACLDGNHTLRDIQLEFAREFQGALIPSEEIESIVNFLDEHGFLLNERFQEIKDKVEKEFLQQKVRIAYHAGQSYSSARHELGAFLGSIFNREGGPGPLPVQQETISLNIVGLVAPHIDFNRGALGYAHAYYKLYQSQKPDTAIIFGVSHHGGETPYIMTRKHFSTPLGTLLTNQECIDFITSRINFNPFQSEIMHRMEHSIEFQVLMLNYLFGTDVKIVPILCSSIEEEKTSLPIEISQVKDFLNACKEYILQSDERILVIAGADLAHVGRRFGDTFSITPTICENVKIRDTEDLIFVTEINPEGFYRSVNKDHNKRRVCGLFAVYSLLEILKGTASKGELLYYGQAPDPLGGIVSFASVAFYT
ncbi:MAG: AmmeMemoRadiSam system protein B [Candidatus Hydrogenedentes bacterium]|nr:AmmeMemoRadiSam system protein B [Candidatus Hydrogenedentota bacterium]